MIELRIPTKEEIDLITFDDEIWERVSDDICPPKNEFELDYVAFEFMGAFLDGKIISLASIEKDGCFHFETLKPYRHLARETSKLFLSQLQRSVYCEIPLCYRHYINFAKKGGFEEAGIAERKFIKNGVSYNLMKLIYKKCQKY